MEHLSDDWISAFDDVVREHTGLAEATAATRLVITYLVEDPDGDHRAYSIVLDHGDNRVERGTRTDADVTLRTDRVTAADIAHNRESALKAFMAGRLRLGGDVRALITHQALLSDIDDCTAALRRDTDGSDAGPERGA